MLTFRDFIVSAWSFYFRWPLCNAQVYFKSGIFLGGILQSFALLVVYALLWFTIGVRAESTLKAEGICLFVAQFGLAAWTGFFHEDGLADTADSLGISRFSAQDEPRIRAAFKDPRLGVFGVSATIGLWLWRYHTSVNLYVTLSKILIAICLSRIISICVGIWICRTLPQNDNPSKISHQLTTLQTRHGLAWASICLLISGFMAVAFKISVFVIFTQTIIACLVAAAGLRWLSRRSGELNGDMLGASACCLEILILLTFSL